MEKMKTQIGKMDKNTQGLIIIILLIFAAMGILQPKTFLSVRNLQGMGSQFAEFGILAFGMMLAMISGGIDLSLVGIANLSGIVAAVIMIALGGSIPAIILASIGALVVGAMCGALNGFFIGYLRIPAMLVTLSGLQLFTGIGLIITKGPAITGLPASFGLLTTGTVLAIPIPVLVFTVTAIALYFLMTSTVYGKELTFMGSNHVASKYTGINNLKVTMMTYMISGTLGAIGGLLMVSHYNSAKTDYGSSYTLLTLLIVVLGGTHPDGGKGRVLGVTLAIIALQLVSSAFNLLRVNAFVKTSVWGLILIVVMVITHLMDRKNSRT